VATDETSFHVLESASAAAVTAAAARAGIDVIRVVAARERVSTARPRPGR